MRPTPRASRTALAFVALGVVWGSGFLCIRIGLEAVSLWQLVLLRVAVGAAVLSVVAVVLHRPWPRMFQAWWRLVVLAAVGLVLPFTMYAYAGEHIPSGLSSIYNAGVPVATALIMLVALRGERVGSFGLTGIAVGAVGIVIVLAPWQWSGAGGFDVSAQLACIVAVFGNGFAFAWTRKMIAPLGLDPISATAAQMIAGTAIQLLYAPWVDLTPIRFDWLPLALLALLGALGTGIAYVWSLQVITVWGAVATSMVTYLVTLVAVILGALLLAEQLEWPQFVGGAIVLVGVALGILGARRARAQATIQSGSGPITS
ncbi:DMT family transporter [Gryllotalpicola sp.]|uniref:DMT family transporter n=1 Tax=Gryllotalpicola sp. TaxID=1932787 RepID=UPI00262ABC65|nr:DMT family transporter [Gryllotalpicola sp.]